jgi:hypothetical protein
MEEENGALKTVVRKWDGERFQSVNGTEEGNGARFLAVSQVPEVLEKDALHMVVVIGVLIVLSGSIVGTVIQSTTGTV